MKSATLSLLPHPSPVGREQRTGLLLDPGFGRVFSDHMVTIQYSKADGWHAAAVGPRVPIPMDPASAVLHYAQEIFEGLKAYRARDGAITLFRPGSNARRFQQSAARLGMPSLPEPLFLEAVEQMAMIDRDWIPDGDRTLYLRPFMFATNAVLGVKASSEYLFAVIATPAGNYFGNEARALKIWVSKTYARAAAGGTGAAKCGGNYAAGIIAQSEATARGCDQVVFLDAAERRWIEELSGMNIFFVFKDGSLLTPPLNGNILAGVTRDSLITLARRQGRTVIEEPYSLAQWREDAGSGRLIETFACGTAAVVAAIGEVKTPDGDFVVADGAEGPCASGLRAEMLDIQHGRAPDSFGWVHTVVPDGPSAGS